MNLEISPRLCSVKQTYTRNRAPRFKSDTDNNEKQKRLEVSLTRSLYPRDSAQLDKNTVDVDLTDTLLPTIISPAVVPSDSKVPSVPPAPYRKASLVLTRSPIKNKISPGNLAPQFFSQYFNKDVSEVSQSILSGSNAIKHAHKIFSVNRKESGSHGFSSGDITPMKTSKKKDCAVQCDIRCDVGTAAASAVSAAAPAEQPAAGGSLVCTEIASTDDMIVLEYYQNGNVYKGVLLKQRLSPFEGYKRHGYFAQQLPPKYLKKIKTKLGLSFDSGRDSETSDTESITKAKLKKLKVSEIKTIKQKAKRSLNTCKAAKKKQVVTTSEPASGSSNMNGIISLLNGETGSSSKYHSEYSLNETNSKKLRLGPQGFAKEKKSVIPNLGAEITIIEAKSEKPKFGEKFLKKNANYQNSTPTKIPKEDIKPLSWYKNYSVEKLKKDGSCGLSYVNLQWPRWCPRSLKLEVSPLASKPRRCKIRNSRKRRISSSSSIRDMEDIKFSEKGNPFGIGDVVICRRVQAMGKPYWPAKVLSTTGVTVCVSFYNTFEVVQVAQDNVEWFYDGCVNHKLLRESGKTSKEWGNALRNAQEDVRSSVGIDSIVWGRYEDEWWPAKVIDLHQHHRYKYKVIWFDNSSIEVLAPPDVAPFLLAYNLYFNKVLLDMYDNYSEVVHQAWRRALMVLLETKNSLTNSKH